MRNKKFVFKQGGWGGGEREQVEAGKVKKERKKPERETVWKETKSGNDN